MIGEKNEYKIVVTSPDYMEFKFLWGMVSFEKGEKKEFTIRGTEAYVNKIVSSIEHKNLNAVKILR